MFRIITVSREFGSGGAEIGASLAEKLQWKLYDRAFLSEVARRANVEPELARKYDEQIDMWLHRITKRVLWRGSFERVSPACDLDFFDAETMASLSTEIIHQAAGIGNCVIVGRGAQCILQDREDTFHVFVYAPMQQKVRRLQARVLGVHDWVALARAVDQGRSEYIRARFGCNWKDIHLYDLLVNSALGCECVTSAILGTLDRCASASRKTQVVSRESLSREKSRDE